MKIDASVDRLTTDTGRTPTPAEVATDIGESTEHVLEALAAGQARRTLSLDAPPPAGDDPTRERVEMVGSVEAGYDRAEAQESAGSAGLDDRELEVLRLRLERELTQRQIGERMGLSQMQISRISRGALWKLLGAVRGEHASATVPPIATREAD